MSWFNLERAVRLTIMTFNDTSSLLSFLKTRKSASAKAMGGDAPSPAQIQQMLELATRVPDHGSFRRGASSFSKVLREQR